MLLKMIRNWVFILFQGKLEEINVDKSVEFVMSCHNFDGGFGSRPDSETHSGQVGSILMSTTQYLNSLTDIQTDSTLFINFMLFPL